MRKTCLFLSLVVMAFLSISVKATTNYCLEKVIKINQYSNGDTLFYLANSGSGDSALKLIETTDSIKNRQVSFLLAAYSAGKRILVRTTTAIDCSNIPYGTVVDMVLIQD